MDPSADSSPLWGAAQLNYPNFNRQAQQQQQQQPQWTDSNHLYQQVMQPGGYNPYSVPSLEGNFAELRSSPQIVEADSTIAEIGGTIYHGYQQELQPGPSEVTPFQVPAGGYQPCFLSSQLPFSNHNHVLLPETGPYPPSESGSAGRSPDTGYSSSPNQIYPSYQPLYHSAEVPYQNVETVKVEEVECKQEPSDSGAVSYQQQPSDQVNQALDNISYQPQQSEQVLQAQVFGYQQESNDQVFQYHLQSGSQENNNNNNYLQKCDNKKPIIHGNILIRAADNSDPAGPVQYELVNVHNVGQNGQHNEPVQLQYQIIQPTPETPEQQPLRQPQAQTQAQAQAQAQAQTQAQAQRKPRARQRKPRTQCVVDDQQPSTSSAGLRPQASTSRRVVHRNPEAESEEGSMRRSARPSVIEKSDYKCLKCGSYFARQCGLTQHHEWIHEKRKFKCERCGKKFRLPETLATHIITHEMEDKPFKCPVCPKQFCHKNDLRRHMYRHESTTPYQCKQCAKCFIRKDHLLAHQLSHDRREKRYHDKENGSPM